MILSGRATERTRRTISLSTVSSTRPNHAEASSNVTTGASPGPVHGMSAWSAARAKRVNAALLRLGWALRKQVGSHRKLPRTGWPNFTFCFHDSEEVRPAALTRIGKETGLRPEDL
ncbi:MAG: type II toxin-antitoxin system HicA family toxin [Bryobacteraceae bacterium]|nr:type II toxin-antitoxin system HicA family toxin [Bryobacteraceae bacterium]